MNQSPERMNRAQKNAKEYMDKHMLEKIISDMLNTLIHARDEKPLVFMVRCAVGSCPVDQVSFEPVSRGRPRRKRH